MQQMSLIADLPALAEGKTKRHFDAGATSEWYTPAVYVDAARACMGGIDLDPASCEPANKTVRAKRIYTKDVDGLSRPWRGRVWLNPPYSDYRGQAAMWASKLLAEYKAGRVTQAILLVNLSTAYQGPMQALSQIGSVCLVSHRISFVSATGGSQRSPTQANVIFYTGDQERFAEHFEQFGAILTGRHSGAVRRVYPSYRR